MTKNQKMWGIDENDLLYDNWGYFCNNKEIAEGVFSRSWDAIQQHSYELGVIRKKNRFTSNLAILNEARDYIYGLVLGDGSIKEYNKTGQYTQSCKYKNWLSIINEDLYEYGVECTVDSGRLRTGGLNAKGGSIIYNLQTRIYIEFKEMHDRFYIKWYEIDKYPKRRWHKDEDGDDFIWQKIVPKDICLSSECVANWYLGDGSISKHKHANGYRIKLATLDLLIEDVIFLSELLFETLDIKCSIDKAKGISISNQRSVKIFLDYIKDYKVDCYSIKFPENFIL